MSSDLTLGTDSIIEPQRPALSQASSGITDATPSMIQRKLGIERSGIDRYKNRSLAFRERWEAREHASESERLMVTHIEEVMKSRATIQDGAWIWGPYIEVIKELTGYIGDDDPSKEAHLQARCHEVARQCLARYGTPQFPKERSVGLNPKLTFQHLDIKSDSSSRVDANNHNHHKCDGLSTDQHDWYTLSQRLQKAQDAANDEYNRCQSKKALIREFDAFGQLMLNPSHVDYDDASQRKDHFVLEFPAKFAADEGTMNHLIHYLVDAQPPNVWMSAVYLVRPVSNEDIHNMSFVPRYPAFEHLTKQVHSGKVKKGKSDVPAPTWGECYPKLYAAASRAVQFNALDPEVLEMLFALPDSNKHAIGWTLEFVLKESKKRQKSWRFLRAVHINAPATTIDKLSRLAKWKGLRLAVKFSNGPDCYENIGQVVQMLGKQGYELKKEGKDQLIVKSEKQEENKLFGPDGTCVLPAEIQETIRGIQLDRQRALNECGGVRVET